MKNRPNIILNMNSNYFNFNQEKQSVLYMLKYMNKNHIDALYKSLNALQLPQITNIKFKTIGTPKTFGQYIIHIYEIHYNNKIVPSNIYMYKSSGKSRGTQLCGYWLPISGIEIIRKIKSVDLGEIDTSFRFLKPEDEYIYKYEALHGTLDANEVAKLKLYGRFINLTNLIASEYLHNNPINLDENVSEIDYNKKIIIQFIV